VVQTLEDYAYPLLGPLPVEKIDTTLVMRAVEPIWQDKPPSAMRLRGRIETILDWATPRGYRRGDNPARWKAHIENLLPKRETLRAVKHHAALPYREITQFVAALRQHDDAGARALGLVILTGARTNEVLQAPWREFEPLQNRLWTIPAERMKEGKREQKVPLSEAAMAILEKQAAIRTNDYVFPGSYGAKHVGQNLLLQVLARLDRSDLTAHGFRTTFPIGLPRKPALTATRSRWHWCIRSQMRLKRPTAEEICLKSAGS